MIASLEKDSHSVTIADANLNGVHYVGHCGGCHARLCESHYAGYYAVHYVGH